MEGTEAEQQHQGDDALRVLVETIGTHLAAAAGRSLTTVFEQELQKCLSARMVRLREVPARGPARLVAPTRTSTSVVLPVTTTDPRVQAVLEVLAGEGRALGPADIALLGAGAALAGLVLMASRGTTVALPKNASDLRALVGSSAVMSALRDRIDRVAATDFTVLIRGGERHG